MDLVPHIICVLAGSAANTFPCRLVWWSNPALPHYSQAAWLMNDEYAAYLKSEAWAKKRAERLAISKYRCAACPDGNAIHVHHLTYVRIFNEDMADLLPLCSKHHDTAERLVKLGRLPRNENVLFLASETVRLILESEKNLKLPKRAPLTKTERQNRQKCKVIHGVPVRNLTQERLMQDEWFRDRLANFQRSAFKNEVKHRYERSGKVVANALTIYDLRRGEFLLHRGY